MKGFTCRLLITMMVLMVIASVARADEVNFRRAKRILENHVYNVKERRVTFYCGCSYDEDKKIDFSSCGYEPGDKYTKRAERVEWEHVVPASWFGQDLACWKEADEICGEKVGGRECCREKNEGFRLMEADMYNLVPSVGQLNALRSNSPYGEIEGEEREFGSCDFEVTKSMAEPAEEIRGDIARIMLYMDDQSERFLRNPLFSMEERERLLRQSEADPPSEWEIERNRFIFRYQRNMNLYVVFRSPVDGERW